jgi:hypothetical protein
MCETHELTNKQHFHIEEYKILRSEVLSVTTQYMQMKILSLGFLGAMYSWMFIILLATEEGTLCYSKLDAVSTFWVLEIPAFIAWLLYYEGKRYFRYIVDLSSYIGALERALGENSLGLKPITLLGSKDYFWITGAVSSLLLTYGFIAYALYYDVASCSLGSG